MEGSSSISPEVLASYAADAAREVPGVRDLVEGGLRHRGVRVSGGDDEVTVELHVALDWGAGYSLSRTATVRATSYMDMLVIPAYELRPLMEQLPFLETRIRAAVRHHLQHT